MIEEEVQFKTSRGLKLSGVLLAPNEDLRDVVVFAHGTGSSKSSPRNRGIAEKLLEAGIGSFLFDFTGHGESDGLMAQSTQSQQFDDLTSALDFLDEQSYVATRFIGVHGSSTGGTVAIRAAAQDLRIQVMVLRHPRSHEVLQYAPLVQVPTLIIQGSEDQLVLPESQAIFEALKCDRELHIVQGAGHLFDEDPEFSQEMTDVACDWFVNWFGKLAETE